MQFLAHLANASRHERQGLLPFFVVNRIGEDACNDPCAVRRRARHHGPLKALQLPERTGRSQGTRADEGQGPYAFSVQAKVLGKRLRDEQGKAFLDKMSHSESIAVQIAGCEALISAIEEGKQLPTL